MVNFSVSIENVLITTLRPENAEVQYCVGYKLWDEREL